uniref:Uncharacterized protein n=1 Tax=Kalmanozyma brasiliensis (strain GHG001) TaxID=1365824 RepID=V5EKK5_KALBG
MAMAAARPQGARPMPSSSSSGGSAGGGGSGGGGAGAMPYYGQTSLAFAQPPPPPAKEAAWYEYEERMRPSYIQQPPSRPLAPSTQYNQPYNQRMPPTVSPSAYASANAYTSHAHPYLAPQQQQAYQQPIVQRASPAYQQPVYQPRQYTPQQPQQPQRYPQQAAQSSRPPPAPSAKYANPHLNSAPSRFANNPSYRDTEEPPPRSTVQGSAFMHKGFWDILSLVNNQGPSQNRLAPPSSSQRPSSPGKFRATLSKASGALRKNTQDAFQAGPEYGANAAYIANASPRGPSSPRKEPSVAVPGAFPRPSFSAPSTHTANASAISTAMNFFTPAIMGPKAQKKRISVDMVGAPQTQTFVHAAHASDAEQAEVILHRWGRDGVGKVADPTWVEPIKEALRLQAARNQAEAIAQVQAAMHQESLIRDNPRPLQIVNGAPSQISMLTTTTATAGHSTLSNNTLRPDAPVSRGAAPALSPARESKAFAGIAEEPHFSADAELQAAMNAQMQLSSQPAQPVFRPAALRTNTAGTLLVNPSPPVARDGNVVAPDYMMYRPPSPGASNRNSRNIDGLPSAAPNAINAMFEAPAQADAYQGSAERRNSMVILDSLRSVDTAGMTDLADFSQPIGAAPRDPMLRDREQGPKLLEMRKQLAFVGYTFKSPKAFDPREQLADERNVIAAEKAAGMTPRGRTMEPTEMGSRIRSMSM